MNENRLQQFWHELINELERIEDKIRERGMLISLCGEQYADCTLTLDPHEKCSVRITLKIEAARAESLDKFILEQIQQYIASKTHDAFEELGIKLNVDKKNIQVFLNDTLVNGD